MSNTDHVKRESYFSRFRKRWKRRGVVEIDESHSKHHFTSLIRHGLQSSIVHSREILSTSSCDEFSEKETKKLEDGSSFEFVSYAPQVFESLREQVGFSASQYKECICPDDPSLKYLEFVSNSKSGQNFFLSNNKQLMIKTIARSEKRFFCHILRQYIEHLKKYPHTLLVRYLGLYKIAIKRQDPVYFIVMQSILYPEERIDIRFDLKACAAGRNTKEKDEDTETITIYKDVNFGDRIIHLGPQSDWFFLQIGHDTAFLQNLRVIDYSLLIGVQNLHADEIEENSDLAAIVCRTQKSVSRNHSVRRGWPQSPSKTMFIIEEGNPDLGVEQSDNQLAVNLPGTVEHYKETAFINEGSDVDPRPSLLSNSFSHSSLTEAESLTQNRRLLPKCRNELHVIDGNEGERYYVGVIDFFSTYNVRKRFECIYKGIKYKRSGLTFSAVNPDLYAARFREFISSHVS